jgi:hypothetical protein
MITVLAVKIGNDLIKEVKIERGSAEKLGFEEVQRHKEMEL